LERSQSKPDASDEKRIKTLNAEIASLESEVAKLRQKSAGISDQIKELQNKILEVGGVKLRAIQSKVVTTKGLLDLANESITKAEVGQAKAERDVEKLTKSIDASKAKMEEVQAELDIVDGDLQACTADLNVLREKVQEAVDASTDVQDALAQSKAELDEKMEGINSFRALEVSLSNVAEESCSFADGHQAEDRGQRSVAEGFQGQAQALAEEARRS
jgi:structural maintenance of chromosome 4